MIRVSIIGSGNVAQHLVSAFTKSADIELVQVLVRRKASLSCELADNQIISDYHQLQAVDLFIIAVTDQAIAEVAAQIPLQEQLVAHTSGSVAMNLLADKHRKAVFYPLQTFTKGKPVDFKSVPIGVETQRQKDAAIVKKVAGAISNQVFEINSEQRKALHVAAVFVCNFTNHLYQIGADICEQHQLPFDILKPLIEETAAKIKVLTPSQAQTGPAKRNDQQTIDSHLEILDGSQKAIYSLLTKSIQTHE
ncbi:DUF2520 domain-containing protein [Flavobacterium sp. CYK-4]|uniref:Rossmann-like and DUF2520 domain-containing protein n=1 Tax=Flavobacterium lotistagni TaxID=2709660 RepID=UPI0014075053|nr:DUF2520 domain-containing protein [Flavobacterium lotistagni]NHM07719.1 DUF2520 domain-containing protein [Flavobacterium lotistagni]